MFTRKVRARRAEDCRVYVSARHPPQSPKQVGRGLFLLYFLERKATRLNLDCYFFSHPKLTGRGWIVVGASGACQNVVNPFQVSDCSLLGSSLLASEACCNFHCTKKKKSQSRPPAVRPPLVYARRVLPLLPRTKMRGHSTLWDSSAGVLFQCAC